jgi:hypothetical protein
MNTENNTPLDPIETIEPTAVDSIEAPKDSSLVRKKRGRPKKALIASKKEGSRGKVGRPAGEAAAIKEYKARLLASPKSRRVLDSILNAALDDEHKNQAAAWKLLVDRLMPLSYFEKDKDSGGRAAVNITISGVGGENINIGSGQSSDNDDYEDYVDGEIINDK